MEYYKHLFIDTVDTCGALKIGSFTLKSGRPSPWFFDISNCYNGESINDIAKGYAHALLRSKINFDSVYGIPEKASSLAGPIAIKLFEGGKNISFFSTRKMQKDHGEGTKIPTKIVGQTPKEGAAIAQIDDVFTTGATKYEERKKLEEIGKFTYPVLVVGIDRQEIDEHGQNPVEEYERTTGTKVISVVKATDIYKVLKYGPLIQREELEDIIDHLMKYGTEEAKQEIANIKNRYTNGKYCSL